MLILALVSYAVAATVDIQTTRLQTADPIDMSSTRLNFTGGEGPGIVRGYGLGTELNEGASREVHYRGLKGSGHARFEPAPATALTLTTGVNRLANVYPGAVPTDEDEILIGEDEIIPIYSAALKTGTDEWSVQTDVAHDYVYQDWSSPRAATGLVNGTKYALTGELRPYRPVHWRGTAAWIALNDRNEQRAGETTLMFDVLDRRDHVRVGAGIWYDDLLRRGRAYWTPRDFASYTARTEALLHYDQDLALNVEANVGYGGERLKARDLAYALTAKIQYRLKPAWHLVFGCVRMESFNARGLSTWFRNDLYASLAAQL